MISSSSPPFSATSIPSIRRLKRLGKKNNNRPFVRRIGCIRYLGLVAFSWCFVWTLSALHRHSSPTTVNPGADATMVNSSNSAFLLWPFSHLYMLYDNYYYSGQQYHRNTIVTPEEVIVRSIITGINRKSVRNKTRRQGIGMEMTRTGIATRLLEDHMPWLSGTVSEQEMNLGSFPGDGRKKNTHLVVGRSAKFLWESVTAKQNLPSWMIEYFAWHHEQRKHINATNWRNVTMTYQLSSSNHSDSINVASTNVTYIDTNTTARYVDRRRSSATRRRLKYLVMRCLNIDSKCGGTSDRLQSIPWSLWVAYKLQRMLLIQWERPYPLEYFLQPPMSVGIQKLDAYRSTNNSKHNEQTSIEKVIVGLDWRAPVWMDLTNYHRRLPHISTTSHVQRYLDEENNHRLHKEGASVTEEDLVLQMRHQSHDHGKNMYDDHALQRNEPAFTNVYSEVWKIVFEPSDEIKRLIQQRLRELDLTPYQYTALHIRSLYTHNRGDISTGNRRNINMPKNAIQCASALSLSPEKRRRRVPILIASDSTEVAQRAADWGRLHGEIVVLANLPESDSAKKHISPNRTNTISGQNQPLHLDRGSNFLSPANPDWMEHPPSSYYDVFIDLYLIAMAECVAYDVGGYGKWGSIISGNSTCIVNHALNHCRNMTSRDADGTANGTIAIS